MKRKFVHVYSCFPKVGKSVTAEDFVGDIMQDLVSTGAIEYAGYLEDDMLRSDLIERMGTFDSYAYQKPADSQVHELENTIEDVFLLAYEALPIPELPIQVFVFPWFPNEDQRKDFGGVNAVAIHMRVIHIYVSLAGYSQTALRETMMHEYAHLAYYAHHEEQDRALIDDIVMEGIAENFREETIGGECAPWSSVYSKEKAFEMLEHIRDILNSSDQKIRDSVLYGDENYIKWGGYSIGYWLVHSLRKVKPDVSWDEIIKKDPFSFLPEYLE